MIAVGFQKNMNQNNCVIVISPENLHILDEKRKKFKVSRSIFINFLITESLANDVLGKQEFVKSHPEYSRLRAFT